MGGYGYEMVIINQSSSSYIVISRLKHIDLFCKGGKTTRFELNPGEEKRVMFAFQTDGKSNEEYGNIVFDINKGCFGSKIFSVGFVAPEFSDHVVPCLNNKISLIRIVNRRRGIVVQKMFDHKFKEYILTIEDQKNRSTCSEESACQQGEPEELPLLGEYQKKTEVL